MEILQYVLERHSTTSLTLILTQNQLRQQILVAPALFNDMLSYEDGECCMGCVRI